MNEPLSRSQRSALWVRLIIRAALTATCLWLLARFGGRFCSLFAPFLLALVVAWMLHPPVRWLNRKLGVSRRLLSLILVILCYSAVGGALYGIGYAAFRQTRQLVENWVYIRRSLVNIIATLSDFISRLNDNLPQTLADAMDGLLDNLLNWAQEFLPAALDVSLGGVGAVVTQIPSFVIATVVFMMASYFITADYPRLRFMATDRLPPSVREFGSNFRRIFREAFGGYIKAQLILSFGVFCILALGFAVIGQSYGLLLAAIFAVLDFIPIIGSGTVMVPWAVIALALGNWQMTVKLMIIWGLICVFRRVAEPKVLGDQTGLAPILSLVGIYVGMELGGVLGMVCGPLLLLVLINLWKLGTFDNIWNDVKLCAGDLSALLSAGKKEKRE